MIGPFSITANGQSTPELGAPQDKDGGAVIQISGTWTGTLEFQVTEDGTNYTPVSVQPIGGGAAATTTTTNGVFRVPSAVVIGLGGINRLRVSSTAAWTGTAVISSTPFVLG